MTKPKLPIWFPIWLREISPQAEGPSTHWRSSKLALIQTTKGGRQWRIMFFHLLIKIIVIRRRLRQLPLNGNGIVLLCHLTLNLVSLESYLHIDVTITANEISFFFFFLFFFNFSFFVFFDTGKYKRKEKKRNL